MAQDEDESDVTLYWRPGCFFCSRLMKKLDRSEIPHRLVNIWEHPEAAATVREHARGNETVPTVRVGRRWFVNPSFRDLAEAYDEISAD